MRELNVGLNSSNAVPIETLLAFCNESVEYLEKFVTSIRRNSVGYIMAQNTDLSELLIILNNSGIFSECIYYNEDNGVIIYKLQDISFIIMNTELSMVNVSELGMDYLKMDLQRSEDILFVNERYNKHLKAYSIGEDGVKKSLRITEVENGLLINTSGVVGVVLLTYENLIYSIGVYLVPVYFCIDILMLITVISL